MLIASCTSIIRRLTARQDDGRVVTVSVIPLPLPASSQTLGYQLIPFPDGIHGFFYPYTKVGSNLATARQKKGSSRNDLDTTFSKRLNYDNQNTHAETHKYHRAAICLVSSHLQGFSCWGLSKGILCSKYLTLGSKSTWAALFRGWPMVSPSLARHQLPKPHSKCYNGVQDTRGQHRTLWYKVLQLRGFTEPGESKKKGRGGRRHSHTCFSPLLKKPQGIL